MNAQTRIAALAPRLAPLLGKLASDHDGEILASVQAVRRLLERQGLSFNDLGAAIAAEPVVVDRDRQPEPEPDPADHDWCAVAEWCASRGELLSEREHGFVDSMRRILRRQGATPTPKQAKWLRDIAERLAEEGVT